MESEKETSLVQKVFLRMKNDTAFRAALKRADNPATEYKSWEYLADYKVDLDKDYIRLPYATVFAAMAKSGMENDGIYGLGQALCAAYEWKKESEPARSKLRRIIACSDVAELCSVLRSVLQFIASKNVPVCYQQLLNDLIYFGDGEKVKSKWAQQFYGTNSESGEEDE
ncbi:MAG: type I-E CRISPR-associated protein Cse2/CasB [Treponema sp.]|nr:type I-E CRISPR-associated protein Cse2/CasB [Treponema sp.]